MAEARISWGSKRQDVVTLSSTEAEYYALSEGGKKAIWLRRLLIELGVVVNEAALIRVDNGSQALAENPQFHQRNKHIHICLNEK